MKRGDFSRYQVVYRHLWRIFSKSWRIRLSFILQFINRVIKIVFMPIAISLIITELVSGNYENAMQSAMLFVFLSLVFGALAPLIKYLSIRAENRVYSKIYLEYVQRLIGSDLEYFNSNLAGYLTTATRHYADNSIVLERNLRDKYMGLILSLLLPMVIITYIDLTLGIVVWVFCIALIMYMRWSSRIVDGFRKIGRELYKKNSGLISDITSNILTIKSASLVKEYSKMVAEGIAIENKAYVDRFDAQVKLIIPREAITVLFFLVILWLTIAKASSGAISSTSAVLVITYLTSILNAIVPLSDTIDEHDDIVDKIIPGFEVLNRQNKIIDPAVPIELGQVRGQIEFREVSFTYRDGNEAQVLEKFSLLIPAGQKVGVVGVSGSGKTTLMKLLMRFDDVDNGSVMLDGIDIRHLRQDDFRRQIAYVPQEPLLFHTTIRDNLLLAGGEFSDKRIVSALKSAHAYDFVQDLDKGLESVVGERGVKLSGGQKQRIVIARAVLRNAPIMVLDEATSALDSESEQIIKNSFKEILKDKTAIVVAHRLSTLSDMDRIIVIAKGKLVEDGTHASLLEQKGVYSKLWNQQLRLAD
ncbi:ABC transporter ATP-binding protein [Candidatus Saccharibacteria bacterium]|nr:ABC transporter ATP-binding protein [Candidatus Saccharibacteria bacterium]